MLDRDLRAKFAKLPLFAACALVLVGLAMVVVGARLHLWPAAGFAVLGLLHIGVAAYALAQHLRARKKFMPVMEREVLRTKGDLALLAIYLPWGALVLAGVALATFRPEPARIVTGRPAEVRTFSRSVTMPDGHRYVYRCWKDRRRSSGVCDGERAWDRLGRWPEPRHVEMWVVRQQIRGLVMDGEVIVSREEGRAFRGVMGWLSMTALGAVLTLMTWAFTASVQHLRAAPDLGLRRRLL
jgi:hypothetical protein